MASEMLSKVLDAENSDKEAQKAAHEQVNNRRYNTGRKSERQQARIG